MQLTPSNPRKALNKAYLKVKPSRNEIELFKKNLIGLLDGIDESESEEHVKNDLGDFLKNTFYQPKFYLNTKDRTDLVIHNGPDAKSFAGVLIESKKPSNKSEMIRQDNLNTKAFHELILYYLRERITNHNLEIKHLVATNIYEWFVFDATLFEKTFAQNKTLVNQFTDFEEGRLAGKTTDFFYKEIAEPIMAGLTTEICFTWFDFREYDKPLRNDDKKDDSKLIALYKLLSPEHLLKLPFTNDSNSLDKAFYAELLHIIGLTETKEGSKKLIGRKKEGERNPGSLIESAITQLDSLDKISRLEKSSRFGENIQERLFNVALELSITWINRILFLKLLEAQLIKYQKGDDSFAFLNKEKIENFDDLNSLFFSVLARKSRDRNEEARKLFANVPYLNSSLFEPTDLEHSCLFISQLKDGKLPVISSTVLKDNNGNKCKGELVTLDYIFQFLDAYDFAGEGSEEIQEENKTLINASVLGLIFEKINGYKDGSFFTPGFITMYMCRETIRRAVVQKFNEAKGWACENLDQVYDKINDRGEANNIINSLKICDPAVGSGHFLVSALNEIIAIKSDLNILQDREGRRLKEYQVDVVNDELIVTDEDGELFEYNPGNKESHRIQQTLFHEKQTIIENCLFGVDINPNSVKICRLRLWIELLKNAYYKKGDELTSSRADEQNNSSAQQLINSSAELETLPNIDINIKCGNSLISRYALDADIKQALKKSKWSIDSYRMAVMSYRNATSKEEKRSMERLIESIKSDFETEVAANDKRLLQLNKLNGELFNLTNQTALFERSKKELEQWNKKIQYLVSSIKNLELELEEIKNNKIYENAFEWRFEFPEVLNDEGDFIGFDVVIGNPPYIRHEELGTLKNFLQNEYLVFAGTADILVYFFERGINLLSDNGCFCMITSNKFMRSNYGRGLRNYLRKFQIEQIIDFGELPVFEEASTFPAIYFLKKINTLQIPRFSQIKTLQFDSLLKEVEKSEIVLTESSLGAENWTLASVSNNRILEKMRQNSVPLGKYINGQIFYGIKTGFNDAFIINDEKRNELVSFDAKSAEIIYPFAIGDDIRKYNIRSKNRYIILTKTGISIEEYPAIFKHLKNYQEQLEKRWDKGKHWWELRACDYYNLFLKPKIVYPDIAKESRFSFSEDALILGNTCYFIPTEDLYLVALLNSRIIWFYYSSIASVLGDVSNGGRLRWFTQDVSKLPIVNAKIELTDQLGKIVNQILAIKRSEPSADTSASETEIDRIVYELYGLTEEEINIVEGERKI
jgi:adenine-specific DNA-methyltransferase